MFGSSIFFSSATDPYQYAELKYRLSRKCLKELLIYRPAKLTMHTRSHLILQDLEILKQFGDILKVGVSVTTDSEIVQRQFEPMAPSIARRIELIKGLSEAGIKVHASLAPLLPCNPERLVDMLKPYVSGIWIDSVRYKEVNTKLELLKRYEDFFEEENYLKTQNLILEQFGQKILAKYTPKKSDALVEERVVQQKAQQLSLLPI